MNKKGNAFAWITALGTLFIVAIIFLLLTNPMNQIFDATNYTGWNANYQNTRSILQTVWTWWPAFVLLGVALFVLVQTLRRDTYGGYT
jgi:hypothetical protein